MTDSNLADSDFNDNSEISSQLTEIRENYEKEINELQAKFSHTKDLMMTIKNKPIEDGPPGSSQDSPKQSRSRLDRVTGVTIVDNTMMTTPITTEMQPQEAMKNDC